MAHLGEKTVARELLEIINPTNFHFLSKQYMTILHLTPQIVAEEKRFRSKATAAPGTNDWIRAFVGRVAGCPLKMPMPLTGQWEMYTVV